MKAGCHICWWKYSKQCKDKPRLCKWFVPILKGQTTELDSFLTYKLDRMFGFVIQAVTDSTAIQLGRKK